VELSVLHSFPTRRSSDLCIFCGYCQEVCPEEAIFLMKDYSLTGTSRKDMIYDKEKLLALGGVHNDKILKWSHKAEEAEAQGVKRSEEHTSELQSRENLVC